MVRIEPFSRAHLDDVVALCAAEGWPSWTPESTSRALSGQGVVAVVAVERGSVVGVAELLWDGAVSAYLALLVVSPDARGHGIGRALIDDLFARTGAARIDTLAEIAAAGFYESLRHKTKPGFRLYPNR